QLLCKLLQGYISTWWNLAGRDDYPFYYYGIQMNSVKEIISKSTDDLPEASELILNFAGPTKVWTCYGEMGAGETTLINAVCEKLGVTDVVSSPTFAIVNEYATSAGETIFHFDFYRINTEREALDIGCAEYFCSGDYCFIEWPS